MRGVHFILLAGSLLSGCSVAINSQLNAGRGDKEAPILSINDNSATVINTANQSAFPLSGMCVGAENGQPASLYVGGSLNAYESTNPLGGFGLLDTSNGSLVNS